MIRRNFLKSAGVGLGLLTGAARSAPAVPNIIFILADDIGYGDLSCYGATKVRTPNTDRVAKEGMRFTDAHAGASVCSPTRYGFMTGQYAFRNPLGDHILSGEAPLSIKPGMATVASVLKPAGYATGIVGKWHMGLGDGEISWNTDIKPGPLELGFDYAFYYPATNDRVPCVYVENHRIVGLDPKDPIRVRYSEKIGDEPTGKENPELLRLKIEKGHDGTIVDGVSRIGFMSGGKSARWHDEDMADTLTRKATGFIERNKDRPFFLYLATNTIHAPRLPNARFKGTSGCGNRCDTIHEFDSSVGEVLATLDRLKLTNNTLLIISSDNGGNMDDGYVQFDARDANGHKCNGDLRGYKGSLYEGGNREPFIARWPGKIKAGSKSDELVCLVDLMATFSAVAGKPLAAGAGPDSFNMLPVLLGKKSGRDNLVVQAGNGRVLAIRQGQWKFIPSNPQSRETQLYDLSADLAESKNLATENPEKVKELTELLARIRIRPQSRP